MNLAGIVLIPFITLCRAVLFEKWQQKKRLCFSVTKNTAAQKLPGRARYFVFEYMKRGHAIWHDL